jgi:hypothetical protein
VSDEAKLVGLAGIEIVWLLVRGSWTGPMAWAPLLAAVAGHAALVSAVRLRPVEAPASILVLSVGAAILAAVVANPRSRDLYQYALYGRMHGVLGLDPYVVPPRSVDDPLVQHAPSGWGGAVSVYGPLATFVSALGARAFGTSVALARAWFQGLAALSLLASAGLIWRRRGRGAAACLGLSPVMLAAVNGGHVDALVGLLVLWAALLAEARHPVRAGGAIGLAVVVKASVLPMALGAAVAAASRRHRGDALLAIAMVVGVVVVGYSAVGGTRAVTNLGAAGRRDSRASLWAPVTAHGLPIVFASSAAVLVVVVVAIRWRRQPPVEAGLAVLAAAILAAPYVLPWYPAAMLPAAQLAPASPAARLASAAGTVLLLAYVVAPGASPQRVPASGAAAFACSVCLGVTVALLLRGPPSPSPVGGRRTAGRQTRGQGMR